MVSKRVKAWQSEIDKEKKYTLEDAIVLSQKFASKKFNESLDLVVRLGIDPKKGDQTVRGSITLPNGTGKSERIVVFAKGEKEVEAKEAGADHVGASELSDKIKAGWMEFDRVVATPDMMIEVAKIGKILGPRGLMPNPKLGTVTMDLKTVIADIKKGKVEFRNDSNANLQVSCGRLNFSKEHLRENVKALLDSIMRLKPASSKGVYMRSAYISSTMGPGIQIDESIAG